MKRIAALLCALVLLITLLPSGVTAAPDDTVYVRKHVSLLYDNSGSMSMKLANAENLKWCYGSYAAQAFTGLLNDMDTLTVTFMNSMEGGVVKDSLTSSLALDMTGSRQDQVTRILEETSWAKGGTPLISIEDALQVLVEQGLKSDEELEGTEVSGAEQYWLVLTTDGVFDTSAPGVNGNNLPQEAVEEALEEILKEYSSLQLVYFGIGAKDDSSSYKAVDFGKSTRLTAYPNFTAVYAEDQDKIVSTMQGLSNRISGRYAVNEGVQVSGNTVTMNISGETSPVRNIGILAQNTGATLQSAAMQDGTPLQIVRSARLEYPRNDAYDQMPEGTLGGCTAMVSCQDGKIPAGTVVLTFDQPVSAEDLSLMYEPAIYVALSVQRQNSDGQWEDVPYTGKLVEGDTLRVQYSICEDGSDEPLDPSRLPGKTEAQIMLDGEPMELGEAFTMKEGSSVIAASVSMMDGAYCVSTSRTIRGVKFTDFDVASKGPLTMGLNDLKENTSQSLEFTVSIDGVPATKEQLASFALDMGGLKGAVEIPEDGLIRFTPKDPDGKSGTYMVSISFDGKSMASETVTVEPNPTTYTAEAGEPLAVYDKDLKGNDAGVIFQVTAHKDEGDFPVTLEESFAFSVEAKSGAGEILGGTLKFDTDGQLRFIPGGEAAVGDYTVTLYYGGEALASGLVTVLRYDAVYTVEALLPENREVNRFDLRNNETAVDFIVRADGVPLTADQLSAMLGSVILGEMDVENSLIRLELTVAEVDGTAAVHARPTSGSDNVIVAFFQKTLIAWGSLGGVPKGDLTVTLTVDAVKGDSASGVLQVVSSAGDDLFYKFLFLVLAAVAGLILWFIYCNLKMPRIKAGWMYYYELELSTDGYYYITSSDDKKVRGGIFFRLAPTPQTMTFGNLRFTAGAGGSYRWGRAYSPEVELYGFHEDLKTYGSASCDERREAFLNELALGGRDPDIMDEWNVSGLLPTVPVVTDAQEPEDGSEYRQPVMMPDNGFLVQNPEDGTLKIWAFRPKNG